MNLYSLKNKRKAIEDLEDIPEESFLSEKPQRKAFYPALIFALVSLILSGLCWIRPDLKESLISSYRMVFYEGEIYRLLTALFIHSHIAHFLSNMLFLIPFSGLLNFYFGWKMFPVYGLVLGMITQVFSLASYSTETRLIGSSGMLFALFGLWLALYYQIEKHVPRSKRILIIMGVALVMLIPSTFSPQVSYRSHWIGFILGVLVGILYVQKNQELIQEKNFQYRMKVLNAKDTLH